MILHVLRGLFILLMAAAGWFYLRLTWLTLLVALALAVLFVSIDVLAARRKLAVFAGTLFGLLVGHPDRLRAELRHPVARRPGAELMPAYPGRPFRDAGGPQFIKLVVALVTCYLPISFTLQTKDDFRFIIPYVEFKKDDQGARPFLLDTSVLIDGRIADIVRDRDHRRPTRRPAVRAATSCRRSPTAPTSSKRNRGRRGLDVLAKLRNGAELDVVLYDVDDRGDAGRSAGVDQRLIDLAERARTAGC